MRIFCNNLFLSVLLSTVGFFSSNSNALVLNNSEYSITFAPSGWDTVQTSSILRKDFGINGVVLLTCAKGSTAPNLDSMVLFYADSLGGRITKGKDSSLTLGNYKVNWQDFKYDSLPKLSAAIKSQSGFPIQLKDGSFRLYYLLSNGFVFTMTGLPIPNPITRISNPPYADMEAAFKTLNFNTQSRIRETTGAWGGSEMWIHNGRLSGAWFSAHRPVSIDCFNIRGIWIGAAQPSGSSGIWTLPAIERNAFLRILLPDGSRYHLPTRD
jgi:hypothetical protein